MSGGPSYEDISRECDCFTHLATPRTFTQHYIVASVTKVSHVTVSATTTHTNIPTPSCGALSYVNKAGQKKDFLPYYSQCSFSRFSPKQIIYSKFVDYYYTTPACQAIQACFDKVIKK